MTAAELIEVIEAAGGRFVTNGDRLGVVPKALAAPVAGDLRRFKAELLAELAHRDAHRLDVLGPVLVRWMDTCIRLDAPAVARRDPNPTWVTSVNRLYRDCCAWMVAHDPVVLPSRPQFLAMLGELGCAIREIGGAEFVCNLALKADWEAEQQFVLADHEPAEPAAPSTPAKRQPTPSSYRILRQELKPPPIRLSESETITAPEKFVATTLGQLEHQLHGRAWPSCWTLQGLIDRLATCGCVVEILHSNQQPDKNGEQTWSPT